MKKSARSARTIWMITREYGDLAGAGGVKDVADQLSRALAAWSGRKVSVVLPLYGFIDAKGRGFTPLADPLYPDKDLLFDVDMNYAAVERRESVRVLHGKYDNVHVYLVDSQRFRDKSSVYTYTAGEQLEDPGKQQGVGHFDYFAMNLLLQKAAIQLMLYLQEIPDVIHCHDGHTALLPAIIAETPWLRSIFRHTGCLVTLHNAGIGYHQEVDDLPYARAMTGLPWQAMVRCLLRGSFDPLVAAGIYATVNTVSENYARELQSGFEDEQTGWLGHHLLDMGIRIEGITNGIDPDAFDPRRGPEFGLAASYDPRNDGNMAGKRKCKLAFLEEVSLEKPLESIRRYGVLDRGIDSPLFTFIGRLSGQKGVDILRIAMEEMALKHDDFQMVVLGSGQAAMEDQLIALCEDSAVRGKICFLSGYSPALAYRVYSAGDFFVIPSRYEPCGLTDYIAQLFGNIPIVNHVGGLVKVVDGETGFAYHGMDPDLLVRAMDRAVAAYRDKDTLRTMQKKSVRLIEEKYTWNEVKKRYLDLYKKVIKEQMMR